MDNYQVDPNTKLVAVLQRWEAQSVKGSNWYHVSRFEWSTGSNKPKAQPQRPKEGGQCWIYVSINRLSWEIAVQSDDPQERRWCEDPSTYPT